MKVVVWSLIFLGCFYFAEAQLCSSLTIVPNVCLLNMNKTFTGPVSQPACASANTDPFGIRSYTSSVSVSAEECKNAAISDGKRCIQMYSEFQCSAYCQTCGEKPCANFCAAIPTICPSANQIGCFDPSLLSVTCAPENTNKCVAWDVDQTKLPEPGTTSTTQRTSTTKTTTSSGQQQTSSAARPLSVPTQIFLWLAIMLTFYKLYEVIIF
jgi:hypothetical protein